MPFVGDLVVVEGCGAYVSGMSAKNYNSFPEAPEVKKWSCVRSQPTVLCWRELILAWCMYEARPRGGGVSREGRRGGGFACVRCLWSP